MVVPFGSARGRRSRTTYRPTVTAGRAPMSKTFTGITSSGSGTASGNLAAGRYGPPRIFCAAPRSPDAADT
ncbi:hypothetical protein Vse01_07500 [Micromonospora sediminimaris]|uniref:Uncharacterized protein n=1 Tax=Micromonospora sediminimaris TaxID=547162 RepID=A0A9W5UMC5_9ACTN|nr:hypothetical protein Vse01_07500 [Micromonospora sediminimaris]